MTVIRSFWPTDDIPGTGWFGERSQLLCVMRLRPEVKALWLPAMRSGSYVQGFEVLCRADAPHPLVTSPVPAGTKCWCCLGIRCDLAHRAGVLDAPQLVNADGLTNVYSWENSNDYDPDEPDRYSGWAYSVPGPRELAWAYGVHDPGAGENSQEEQAFRLAQATDNYLGLLNDDGLFSPGSQHRIEPWPLSRIADWVEEHL